MTTQTPEARFQQLFEEMYALCDEQGWGDPFSYARSREIHLAGVLGHKVADTYSGADAYDEDGPCEYKSTIGEKLTATYNGISVQNSWEEQERYLIEDKIGKYKNHYFGRYSKGKIVEVWKMDANDVLAVLLPQLKKKFESKSNKVKADPRLGYTIPNKVIRQFATQIV